MSFSKRHKVHKRTNLCVEELPRSITTILSSEKGFITNQWHL